MSKPAAPTLSFGAIFAADLKPERIEFQIEGLPCFVELRKLDFGSAAQYNLTGAKFDAKGSIVEVDAEKRAAFLISHTVTDWLLYVRAADGELQATPPPEGDKRAKVVWLEKNCALFGSDFGDWLHTECQRVNGMLPDQVKNSPTPSKD